MAGSPDVSAALTVLPAGVAAVGPAAAPPIPPAPPGEGRALSDAEHRAEVRDCVFALVRELQRQDEHARMTPRAILDEALTAMDRDGRRCWGADRWFTRRRTLLDSCIRFWDTSLDA